MKLYIEISAPTRPIHATIHLPSSKSISNRVLIMAALGGFRHALNDLSVADDTHRLDHLVNECPQLMDAGAGGTTLRFLLAWASIQEGREFLVTGTSHLLQRPHDALVDALSSLGARIEKRTDGFLVEGTRLTGGKVTIHQPISSQYISALLMIAPYMKEELHIEWSGTLPSWPYVRMTCTLMSRFGIELSIDKNSIHVRPGQYACEKFSVPKDWSAAAFWYEIAALSAGSRITLLGLFDDGLQGDVIARDLWQRWVISEMLDDGMALTHRAPTEPYAPVEYDLHQTPDLFQPLIMTCAGVGSPAVVRGLQTLPHKETDRLQATAAVLRSFGLDPTFQDGIFHLSAAMLTETGVVSDPFDPKDDHRVAMSLAPLALIGEPIRIFDPAVVDKSYPGFWEHLRLAGFGVELKDE